MAGPLEIVYGFVSVLSLGLAGYSFWISRRNSQRLKNIFESETIDDVGALLEAYASKFQSIERQFGTIFTRLDRHGTLLGHSIQKVGVKRFNPFQDMGGESSFVIVLLDEYDSGILLTGITMRDGTRLYAKAVDRGGVAPNMSDEEQILVREIIKKYK